MPKYKFRIKLYTPIWTGDASGRAGTGLKMSGLIGGLRRDFAMLVRRNGGSPCDYTGSVEQRCNYERSQDVCPVCAVFGCTGLQRSFKLNLELDRVGITVPEADPRWRNRKHNNEEYLGRNGMAAIGKWLAVSAGHPAEMRSLTPEEAHSFLAREIKVAYPSRRVDATDLILLPLTRFLEKRGISLSEIFSYLLSYSAAYTGLGAKIHQGWGVFDLLGEEDEAAGLAELRRLIKEFPGCDNEACHPDPEPDAIFTAEWQLGNSALGFIWPGGQTPEGDYLATGFALSYRLRRYIKFYETDYRSQDGHANDAEVLPVNEDWRRIGRKLPGAVRQCDWKESVPLVHALFGRDNAGEDNKFAGLVRVSHLFRRDDHWYVRLSGIVPSVYNYRGVGDLEWKPQEVLNFLVRRFSEILENENCWNREMPREVRVRGVQ